MSKISDETLARFEKSNMGWLTHEGELMPCRMYQHFETLGEVPLFRDAYDRYRETCDENQRMMDADLASLDEDEHPAMHRFDGMDDEAKQAFMKTVYTAGWIRMGRSFERKQEPVLHPNDPRRRRGRTKDDFGFFYVEAEGLTESVRAQGEALADIAKRLGCELRAREMKYAIVNYGSRSRPDKHEVLMTETHEESDQAYGFRR